MVAQTACFISRKVKRWSLAASPSLVEVLLELQWQSSYRCLTLIPHGTEIKHRSLKAECHFNVIDIFEQRSSLGGIWNYSPESAGGETRVPQTNPFLPLEKPITKSRKTHEARLEFQTPMYENLETNIPHNLMQYSDQPFLAENQLFPSRESTLQYLQSYGQDIQDIVKLGTQVTEVRRSYEDSKASWQLHYQSLTLETVHKDTYDAVVVASGHYTVPYLPEIDGIRRWNSTYMESIYHSKFYQKPQDFDGMKVLVVGNSASGQDISAQLTSCCRLPVMVSVRSKPPPDRSSPSKVFVPEIVEFVSPLCARRAVRFSDGQVEMDIDAIIFCTGYFYSYPFLSSILPPLIDTGERVQNLYQHIFSINNPSLAFVGLPKPIVPFRTVEGQAAVISRVWSGRLDLPSEHVMHAWEESLIKEQGSGRNFHDLSYPKDLNYYDELIVWVQSARGGQEVGNMPPKWSKRDRWVRERMVRIKEAFVRAGEARHEIRTLEELGFRYEG